MKLFCLGFEPRMVVVDGSTDLCAANHGGQK